MSPERIYWRDARSASSTVSIVTSYMTATSLLPRSMSANDQGLTPEMNTFKRA